MKFDLTSVIPSGETINSAKLRVYCCEDFLELGQYHSRWVGRHAVYRITSPWQAGGTTTTWKTWSTPGGDYDALFGDTCWFTESPVNTWMEYDITEMVQFFVDDPGRNHGVMLRPAMDNPQDSHKNLGTDTVYQGYVFVSAKPESNLQQYKPQVIIEYGATGVPGTEGVPLSVKTNRIQAVQKGNMLHILSPAAGLCSISDCQGRAVATTAIDQKEVWKTIPLTFGNGVYILRVVSNSKTFKRKVSVLR